MCKRQTGLVPLAVFLSLWAYAETRVEPKTLQSYAGAYTGRDPAGGETEFIFKVENGELYGRHFSENFSKAVALNKTTFRPVWASSKVTITFHTANGKVTGATITDDEEGSNYRGSLVLKKVEEK